MPYLYGGWQEDPALFPIREPQTPLTRHDPSPAIVTSNTRSEPILLKALPLCQAL